MNTRWPVCRLALQGLVWGLMYVIIDWHTIGNLLTGVYHRPGYVTSRDETFRFWYPQKRPENWEFNWPHDWGFVADKYPVVATEFGFMDAKDRGAHRPVIGDEEYGEAIIAFFEKRGISWTPWVFDVEWTPNLISDWDHTPTRQGKFFRGKMRELEQVNG